MDVIIPSRFDVAEILRSPHLVGCYGLKPIPQTKDYTCGAAATATVLRYLGLSANEYNCTQTLKTSPITGTSWLEIYRLLKRRGVKVKAWANFPVAELIACAKEGNPTLVEWLDWGGHWVACVGYEPTTKALVFADPAKPRSNFTCHHVDDFEEHWMSGGTGAAAPVPSLALAVRKPVVGAPLKSVILSTENDGVRYPIDWNTKTKWQPNNRRLRASCA